MTRPRAPLPPAIEAWHCGTYIEEFDLDHVGMGEGLGALGPGIYFADRRDVAMLYCRYARYPWLTHVRIDTRGLYNPIWGIPENLRDLLSMAVEDFAAQMGVERLWAGIRG